MASKSQHRRTQRSRPRIFTSPPSNIDMNIGADLAEPFEKAGQSLDTWQHTVLEFASRINTTADSGDSPLTAPWSWSAREVGVLVAAYNGRTTLAIARELAGLFLLRERIVHTSDSRLSSMFHMDDMMRLIESTPDLNRQVDRMSRRNGKEGILMRNGASIRWVARTPYHLDTCMDADLLVLDDAESLPSKWAQPAVNGTALRSPQSKRRQVWYLGHAVVNPNFPRGNAFADVRARGLTGTDPNLCWIEYSALDDRDAEGRLTRPLDDRKQLMRANPSTRVDLDRIAAEGPSCFPPEVYEARHLAVGHWPTPTPGTTESAA